MQQNERKQDEKENYTAWNWKKERLCTKYTQFFNILCLLFSSVSSQLYPRLAKQDKSHLQNSLNISLRLIFSEIDSHQLFHQGELVENVNLGDRLWCHQRPVTSPTGSEQ